MRIYTCVYIRLLFYIFVIYTLVPFIAKNYETAT